MIIFIFIFIFILIIYFDRLNNFYDYKQILRLILFLICLQAIKLYQLKRIKFIINKKFI